MREAPSRLAYSHGEGNIMRESVTAPLVVSSPASPICLHINYQLELPPLEKYGCI